MYINMRWIKMVRISIVVLSVITVLAITYSAFTGQLNINGTAVNRQSGWDIHFENVSSITTSGTAKVLNNHQPTINQNNRTQIQDYEVSLTSPNDSISFTFDVVNDGNYNAKISDIDVGTPQCTSTDSTSATNTCNNLTYTLRYASGATVNTNDVLYAKDKLSFKVTLQFNDITNPALLPSAEVSIGNLGIEIDFEQQGNALVNDDGTVANNKVYHIGDKITLNNEDYWVIENSGIGQDYVVVLKDTVLQGSKYSDSYNSTYETSKVKEIIDDWSTNNFLLNQLKEINGYKARLITKDEYLNISEINSWRYNSGYIYWTMTPNGGSSIYNIRQDGSIGSDGPVGHSYAGDVTVRPVINVYKSALETPIENNN